MAPTTSYQARLFSCLALLDPPKGSSVAFQDLANDVRRRSIPAPTHLARIKSALRDLEDAGLVEREEAGQGSPNKSTAGTAPRSGGKWRLSDGTDQAIEGAKDSLPEATDSSSSDSSSDSDPDPSTDRRTRPAAQVRAAHRAVSLHERACALVLPSSLVQVAIEPSALASAKSLARRRTTLGFLHSAPPGTTGLPSSASQNRSGLATRRKSVPDPARPKRAGAVSSAKGGRAGTAKGRRISAPTVLVPPRPAHLVTGAARKRKAVALDESPSSSSLSDNEDDDGGAKVATRTKSDAKSDASRRKSVQKSTRRKSAAASTARKRPRLETSPGQDDESDEEGEGEGEEVARMKAEIARLQASVQDEQAKRQRAEAEVFRFTQASTASSSHPGRTVAATGLSNGSSFASVGAAGGDAAPTAGSTTQDDAGRKWPKVVRTESGLISPESQDLTLLPNGHADVDGLDGEEGADDYEGQNEVFVPQELEDVPTSDADGFWKQAKASARPASSGDESAAGDGLPGEIGMDDLDELMEAHHAADVAAKASNKDKHVVDRRGVEKSSTAPRTPAPTQGGPLSPSSSEELVDGGKGGKRGQGAGERMPGPLENVIRMIGEALDATETEDLAWYGGVSEQPQADAVLKGLTKLAGRSIAEKKWNQWAAGKGTVEGVDAVGREWERLEGKDEEADALREMVAELNAKNLERGREVQDLTDKLQEATENLEQHFIDADAAANEHQQTIARLNSDLASTQSLRESAESEVARLREDNAEALEAHQAKVSSLESQLSEKSQQAAAKELELAKTVANLQFTVKTTSEVKEQLAEIVGTEPVWTKAIEGLNALKKAKEEQEKEVHKLRENVSALQAGRRSLQESVQIEKLSYQNKAAAVEIKLSSKTTLISELREEVRAAEEKVARAEASSAESGKAVVAKEAELVKLQTTLLATQNKVSAVQMSASKAKEDLGRCRAERVEAERALDQVTKRLDDCLATSFARYNRISELKGRVDSTDAKLVTARGAVQAVEVEKATLQIQVLDLEKTARDLETEKTALEEANAKARQEKDEAVRVAKRLIESVGEQLRQSALALSVGPVPTTA